VAPSCACVRQHLAATRKRGTEPASRRQLSGAQPAGCEHDDSL